MVVKTAIICAGGFNYALKPSKEIIICTFIHTLKNLRYEQKELC